MHKAMLNEHQFILEFRKVNIDLSTVNIRPLASSKPNKSSLRYTTVIHSCCLTQFTCILISKDFAVTSHKTCCGK